MSLVTAVLEKGLSEIVRALLGLPLFASHEKSPQALTCGLSLMRPERGGGQIVKFTIRPMMSRT